MELVERGVWVLELMMSITSVMISLDFFFSSFGLALFGFIYFFFFLSILLYHVSSARRGAIFGGFFCVAIPPLCFSIVM
jgi:hypothetical protein